MKTRIILTFIIVALSGLLYRGFLNPVTTVAKNTAAVSTVNGGDTAFVAQTALNESVNYFPTLGFLTILAILLAIWWKPVQTLLSSDKKTQS